MARGNFLLRTLIAVSTGLLFASPVFAVQVDPAPISDEVVQRVLSDLGGGQSNPLPETLRHHLDESSALIKQIEQSEQSGDSAADKQSRFAAKRMLLAAKIQELETLRLEVRNQFAQTRAKLVSLGLTEKVKEWDRQLAKVEQRFDRAGQALDRVRLSNGKVERGGLVTAAKLTLHDLHGKVKDHEASPSVEPTPTVQMIQPTTIQPKLYKENEVTPPQYLSWKGVPNNIYAFLGGTLLAPIADPTPVEASVKWTPISRQ